MSDMPDQLEDIELPPSTAPDSIPMTLNGFAREDDAQRIANKLASYIRLFGSVMNLERLDGVTIAYDYDAALRDLDRGVNGLRTLTRSNDAQLVGVGMSPAVMRDGVVKVHLLFNAAYIESIDETFGNGDTEAEARFANALYLLAHECGHVQVTTEKDAAFPNMILQARASSYEEAIFMQINEACWEEYAACRVSAPFGSGHLTYYEEALRGVLSVARPSAAEARESFWTHRDLNRVVGELGGPIAQPLRIAAYVFGHIDGSSGDLDISDETRQAIVDAGYTDAIAELVERLRQLWDERPEWRFLSEFDVIGDVARDLYWEEGMLITPDGEGANINVWDPAQYDGPVT